MRSDQENAGEHVYASSHMPGGNKHMFMNYDVDPHMYNVDPHVSSQHYADAIAVVKANILDAVQRPTASRWLYNNNNNLKNSLAFAAMGHPDWTNRQQFLSLQGSQEQKVVEKVNDAYQIMHARGHNNAVLNSTALNCMLSANSLPAHSGLGMKAFPFVAPVLHEQTSTVRVHQIPMASDRALSPSLLVGGGPYTRILPADSSINPSSTQLTIFYAGKVNVYDGVSSIKAQEIMLMAAASNSLPLTMDMCSGTSIPMITPPVPGSLKNAEPPQIDPSTYQSDQSPRDQVGIGPFPATIPQASQTEESAYPDNEPAFPRALPQARKASLARFLERRKERMLSKSPYPVEKTYL